jgi:hypothetical protein
MKRMLKNLIGHSVRNWRAGQLEKKLRSSLQPYARSLLQSDESLALGEDRGAAACVRETTDWLLRAQEHSATADGGVARHFSLVEGWGASYPETTGYIVPTLIEGGEISGDQRLIDSAKRMLDWLVSIQFPDGGIQGGVIGELPRVPVTFNTGQVLIGLAVGARRFGEPRYLDAMHRAASWLRDSQDADGCWRRFSTPFAKGGDKAYETHVSWGLFEAARVDSAQGYGEAGLRQVTWALSCQRTNGWFENCCLSDNQRPLTHTIGYVLRGLLEAHRWQQSDEILDACRRTAKPLIGCMDHEGRLPARLDSNWQAAAAYVCLTGTVQIAICWMMLYEFTGDESYLAAARRATRFVRRTIVIGVHPGVDGAVRGSFPVSGDYGRFQFLNWAAKFTIDANRKELSLK